MVLLIKPTRCTNFSIYSWNRTLHVSDNIYVHHQESSTVHTTIGMCHTGTADCLLASSNEGDSIMNKKYFKSLFISSMKLSSLWNVCSCIQQDGLIRRGDQEVEGDFSGLWALSTSVKTVAGRGAGCSGGRYSTAETTVLHTCTDVSTSMSRGGLLCARVYNGLEFLTVRFSTS